VHFSLTHRPRTNGRNSHHRQNRFRFGAYSEVLNTAPFTREVEKSEEVTGPVTGVTQMMQGLYLERGEVKLRKWAIQQKGFPRHEFVKQHFKVYSTEKVVTRI
jgi:hypothetical protein